MGGSETVSQVSRYVDDAFYEAVRAIWNAKEGGYYRCGKSGHVGRKIAASLSCLGTPSFFMHADEALHGDVGMVDDRDLVILISNGGKQMRSIKNDSLIGSAGSNCSNRQS